MGRKKFDMMEEAGVGPVGQLLNSSSLALSGQGQKITFLPRELLVPLQNNNEVYIQAETSPTYIEELEAIAKDIATVGVRQPLIVFKNEDELYSIISGNRRLAASALAQEKYGADCEKLPCIIQPAPHTSAELKKRMIKDNLQRTKSGYERMREIVVYRAATLEEWAASGVKDHPNLRDILRTELAAADAEITRYLKINEALLPELMERFKQTAPDGTPLMATVVAHRIAKEDAQVQRFILDNFSWDAPLTAAQVTNIMTGYYARASVEGEKEQAEEAPAPAAPDQAPQPQQQKPDPITTYQLSSIHDGITRLNQTCTSLSQAVTTTKDIPEKVERRLLKKIAAEMVKLEALAAELRTYQEAGDGNAE